MTNDKESSQNLIDKHPALQVYETLDTIREHSNVMAGDPVSRIWTTVEEVPFNDVWFKLLKLLDRWRKRVEQASDTEELKREKTLDFIQRVFDLTCAMKTLNGQQFMDAFNGDVMDMLVLIPDGDAKVESTLTEGDLSSLQQQIVDLMKSVRNSSLPAEVKRGLLSALYELISVIKDYDLYGVAGLDEATERYTGTLFRHGLALKEDTSVESVALKEKLVGLARTIMCKVGWKVADKVIEAAAGELPSLPAGQM